MNISTLDGFLTAIACAPKPSCPSLDVSENSFLAEYPFGITIGAILPYLAYWDSLVAAAMQDALLEAIQKLLEREALTAVHSGCLQDGGGGSLERKALCSEFPVTAIFTGIYSHGLSCHFAHFLRFHPRNILLVLGAMITVGLKTGKIFVLTGNSYIESSNLAAALASLLT